MHGDKPNLEVPVKLDGSDIVGLVQKNEAAITPHPMSSTFVLCSAYQENSDIYNRNVIASVSPKNDPKNRL